MEKDCRTPRRRPRHGGEVLSIRGQLHSRECMWSGLQVFIEEALGRRVAVEARLQVAALVWRHSRAGHEGLRGANFCGGKDH